MQVEILTIIAEHFLVMRGADPATLRDTIPAAEKIAAAKDTDAVEEILENLLQGYGLPVEDTTDVAIRISGYTKALS